MNQSEKTRIYVAGPYTTGDVAMNVRKALDIVNYIADRGLVPFWPHHSHFWHLIHPHPYEFWMELDFAWLPLCHAMVRIGGESSGADREVQYAYELGIPVCSIKGMDGESLNTLDAFLSSL